jgi:hypothetical protein
VILDRLGPRADCMSKTEAIRALERQLSRVVFRTMTIDGAACRRLDGRRGLT